MNNIYVAIMEDDIVKQVVVVPEGFPLRDDWLIIGENNNVGIGWKYFNGEFVAPPEET